MERGLLGWASGDGRQSLTLLAVGELAADKTSPKTPSRTATTVVHWPGSSWAHSRGAVIGHPRGPYTWRARPGGAGRLSAPCLGNPGRLPGRATRPWSPHTGHDLPIALLERCRSRCLGGFAICRCNSCSVTGALRRGSWVGAGQGRTPAGGSVDPRPGHTVAMVWSAKLNRRHVWSTLDGIPTKTLVASAPGRAIWPAHAAPTTGSAPERSAWDMGESQGAKRRHHARRPQGCRRLGCIAWTAAPVIRGHARFQDPHTLGGSGTMLLHARTHFPQRRRPCGGARTFPGLADIDFLTNCVDPRNSTTLPRASRHCRVAAIISRSSSRQRFPALRRPGGPVVEKGPRLASREDEGRSSRNRQVDPAGRKASTSSSRAADIRIAKRATMASKLTPRSRWPPPNSRQSPAGWRVGRRPNTDGTRPL